MGIPVKRYLININRHCAVNVRPVTQFTGAKQTTVADYEEQVRSFSSTEGTHHSPCAAQVTLLIVRVMKQVRTQPRNTCRFCSTRRIEKKLSSLFDRAASAEKQVFRPRGQAYLDDYRITFQPIINRDQIAGTINKRIIAGSYFIADPLSAGCDDLA